MRDIKIESLLNETKGNLFEFLVAQKLAQSFQLEAKFLKNIGPEFLRKLIDYQKITHNYHPQLLNRLLIFAQQVVEKIKPFFKDNTVEDILVVGKIALGSHDDRLSEADIVVKTQEKTFLFSLKLNKAHSLINTKSAGIKSFFKTYFSQFPSAESDQIQFNYFVELMFEQFARDMHAFYNLDYQDNLFSTWDETHHPVLPGELPEEAKKIQHYLYSKLIDKLFQYLQQYFILLPHEFSQSLYALTGQSNPEIISIIAIHKLDSDGLPLLQHLHVQAPKSWIATDISLRTPEPGTSFGEVYIKDQLRLQLRVKPMNKFIHPSYKINCAIGLH